MIDKSIQRRELILKGNIWKAVILLAVPAAINDMMRALYNLIDTLFVSSIGNMEVAAVTFVGPLNTMVTAVSVALSVAGTNLIAREIGRKDFKKARNVSNQLLIISTLFGLLLMLVTLLLSEEILLRASATEGIMVAANLYFRITIMSTPFLFFNAIYIAIKRAEGNTVRTMNLNIIAMVIKVVTSYLLIYHAGLGISSLAISTIIGTVFITLYAVYDLFFKESIMKLKIERVFFNKRFIITLFLMSIPVIIEKVSGSFGFVVLNKYVIEYGETVLASYGITNRINSTFFSTVTGFASGLSPIISQNLAIEQVERAKDAIKKAFILGVGISAAIAAIVIPSRAGIAAFFARGDELILYHTINAMGVYSISVIPWAVMQVTNGVFQGTGHTQYNMYISMFRIYLFRLPVVIILTRYTNLGEYSIWYSMLISNILTGVFSYLLYLYRRRDLKLSKDNLAPR